jgi:hypothetical protein
MLKEADKKLICINNKPYNKSTAYCAPTVNCKISQICRLATFAIIGTEKIHFDDREHAREALAERMKIKR